MLPTIKHPTYSLTIPSTNEEIEYRPFLVKEEKQLLMAAESKDSQVITKATCDILKACILNNEIDPLELTSFDVEYIFLKIRGKSIGETINFKVKCRECKKYTPVSVNLDDIKVDLNNCELKKKIMITDKIGIILKPISFKNAEKLSRSKKEDILLDTICACISSIFDENTVYDLKTLSSKEISEWIENLSRKDISEIEKFILQLPKLRHVQEYTCIHCGVKGKLRLEGLEDFFE